MKKEIRFAEPSDLIKLDLPDGRQIEGPKGASLKEFLSLIQPELPADLVGAVVDDKLRELTYQPERNCAVSPMTLRDAEGFTIYKRSLVFLLAACFEKLFPDFDLEVKHSINGGGTLCNVTGPRPFTAADRQALEALMKAYVRQDLPIQKQEITLEEARELFRKKGQADKLSLLAYRKKPYLMTYTLAEFQDYFYGYMLPSTGALKYFFLEAAMEENQFLLRHPQDGKSVEIRPLSKYKRMSGIFAEYHDWQKRLHIDTISSINRAIDEKRIEDVILVSESLQDKEFMRAAEEIASRREQVRVVMIAGPSSSGKTTSSKRLSMELLVNGISPVPIEMDNFFVDRELTPKDADGKYDFESVNAMNIPLLDDCLRRLIAGEEVQLPRYDFKLGKSVPGEVLKLEQDQILILEGIHGLNPALVEDLPPEQVYRIFVSPMTQVNMDRYNRVSVIDVRLLRRIVRDFRDRGYSAQETIARWPSVRRGEERNIIPYQDQADCMINTSLVYEVSALKELAELALRMVPFGTPEYIEANRLLAFLDWVKPLDVSLIPKNSILAEFVGGSNLAKFIRWSA